MFYLKLIFMLICFIFTASIKAQDNNKSTIKPFNYSKTIYSNNFGSNYLLFNTLLGVKTLEDKITFAVNINNIYDSNFYISPNFNKGFDRIYANYFMFTTQEINNQTIQFGFLQDINSKIYYNPYTPEDNLFYNVLLLSKSMQDIKYYYINLNNNSSTLQLQYNTFLLNNLLDLKISYTPSAEIALNNYDNLNLKHKIGTLAEYYKEQLGYGYGLSVEFFNNINTKNYNSAISSRFDYLGLNLVVGHKIGFMKDVVLKSNNINLKYSSLFISAFYAINKYNIGFYYNLTKNSFYNSSSTVSTFSYIVGYNFNKRYFLKLAFINQNIYTKNNIYYNKSINIGFGDYLF